jgi:hypothetical protein
MLNIEGKKTSSFEIPCSIFDIQNRENCWATGFLLLAEPETNSKEQVSSDQQPATRSQRPAASERYFYGRKK